MMSFIQQFYQDCLVKFALMGESPSEEDAGTDRSQQEDTGADPCACKKERKLRSDVVSFQLTPYTQGFDV